LRDTADATVVRLTLDEAKWRSALAARDAVRAKVGARLRGIFGRP